MRTATCKSSSETILLSMSAEDFRSFFDKNPKALADLELKIAGKSVGINAILHHPKALKEFTAFLEEQYAAENVLGWKSMNRFRWKYSSSRLRKNLLATGDTEFK